MAELTRRPRYPARVLGTLNGQSEGAPLSVHEIAARFKVRRETIYHDLRILAEAGYPVTGDEAGRLSRPKLAAGFPSKIPPVPLSRTELAALGRAVCGSERGANAYSAFEPACQGTSSRRATSRSPLCRLLPSRSSR